jgi:peptidoglycan/LPS O-acetylase OafA/YrhL
VSLIFSVGYILIHPDGAAKINSSEVALFWRNVLSFNPLVRLPEFLVGMLTGQLFLSGTRNRKLSPIFFSSGIAVIALITMLAAKIPSPMISAGFLSPAFAAIIYGLALEPRWAQFLAFRPLVVLGEASYSLYLLHSYVMTRVFWSVPYMPFRLRVLFCVAAAIGASVVVYELIEKPARRFLRPKRMR